MENFNPLKLINHFDIKCQKEASQNESYIITFY